MTVRRLLEINAVGTLVGGVERTLQVVGRELLRHGLDLRHIYLHPAEPGQAMILPEIRWEVLGDLSPQNHSEAVHPKVRDRRQRALARLEKVVAEFRPDVIHLNNIYSPIPLLARVAGIPVVRTVHDYRFACVRLTKLLRSGRRCTNAPGIRCLLRGCVPLGSDPTPLLDFLARTEELERYRDLSFIVTKSEHVKRTLVQAGVPSRSLTVIPCCIPLPAPSESLPRRDWLLYVGRMSVEKGIDRLFEACRLVSRGFRLKLAGEGPERPRLERLAERLGLVDRVDWLGHRSYEELTALYRQCRLLVVPSLWDEPFGLVGLEAMAHALPVVASDVGGTREWLRDGRSGMLVKPDAPGPLAAAIEALLRDPGRAEVLGQHGYRDVAERFSPQRIAAEFRDYLDQVAASAGARART